jgi:hypothetical protein
MESRRQNKFQHFSELPFDIQREIIEKTEDYPLYAGSVSKTMGKQFEYSYYKVCLETPISPSEIINSLSLDLDYGAIVISVLGTYEEMIKCATITIWLAKEENKINCDILSATLNSPSPFIVVHDEYGVNIFNIKSALDVLIARELLSYDIKFYTAYHIVDILRKREKCISINTNYINEFIAYDFKTSIQKLWDSPSMLYMFLYMHFGIWYVYEETDDESPGYAWLVARDNYPSFLKNIRNRTDHELKAAIEKLGVLDYIEGAYENRGINITINL